MIARARPPLVRVVEVHEGSGELDLAGRNRIQNIAHLAFEHAPRHRVEGDLGLITGLDPLQRILLECGAKLLVRFVGIDEHHDRPRSRSTHKRPRPQRHLGDEALGGRAHDGLVEVVLRVGQFGREARDRRVHATDIGGVSEPRPFLLGPRRPPGFAARSRDCVRMSRVWPSR